MQSAKDSFYLALRDRLAVVNPGRTVVLEGTSQPAIVVTENEAVSGDVLALDCFHLNFGAAATPQSYRTGDVPLVSLQCAVSYATRGSSEDGVGRGRSLGALDEELFAICSPLRVPICDYTKTPPAPISTNAFWTMPELGEVESSGSELQRTATLTLYFFAKESA